jgi:3-dehydroquinate synthase
MIVENDEFESGMRKLLNLGHTPAHGIESLSEYTISHGKAVALGLEIILKASLNKGYIDSQTYEKMQKVIDKCVEKQPLPYQMKDICARALSDKKRSGDSITLIMVHGVQDCREHKVKTNEILEYLS